MSKRNSNIVTIAGEFKNVIELKAFSEQLYKNLEEILKENELLKEKLAHLESIISNNVPILQTIAEPIADEEVICLDQINKLKKIAMMRELSLDEVKKLDILHKNLRLVRGESTSNFSKSRDVTGSLSTQSLIEIVAANDVTTSK